MRAIDRSRASHIQQPAVAVPEQTKKSAAAEPKAAVKSLAGASAADAYETTNTARSGGVLGAVLGAVGMKADTAYDGHFVGVDGRTFAPNTPLNLLPAVKPSNNPNPTETILYVNGILTPKDAELAEMRAIADTSGAQVIGIHNSTQGPITDLAQCLTDKLDKGSNPAVDTLANTVYNELKAGHNVHLMGYSQGGLITARALDHVQKRLITEDGMSKADAQKLMSKLNVETFGAASTHYPDGPNYVHYINRLDVVPTATGLGSDLNPLDDFYTHAGKGAQVHYFNEGGLNVIGNHLLAVSYLKHRVPFDEARAGNFGDK